MAVALVGSVNRGGGASAASHNTTFPQAPSAGNLLLLAIASTRTGTLGAETVTGWTLLGNAIATRGTVDNVVSLYGKWAVGGDSAPTITHTAAATCTWTMEEWSGLDGNFPSGIPETWSLTNLASGGTTTDSENETAGVNNEWVFAVFGGRVSAAGDLLSAWDATDLTASSPTTASGRSTSVYTATGVIPTVSSTVNFEATAKASSDGGAMAGIGVVGFTPAGGAALTGDASLAITAGLTAAASQGHGAGSSLPITAGFSSSAVLGRKGDADLPVTAGLTSSATRGKQADAALPVTVTLEASATVTPAPGAEHDADADLPITVGLTASATVGKNADASLPITVGLSSTATRGKVADAELAVTAGRTAGGILGRIADAVLAVVAGRSADASKGTEGAAQLPVTVTLTASATVTGADTSPIRTGARARITTPETDAAITTPQAAAAITTDPSIGEIS